MFDLCKKIFILLNAVFYAVNLQAQTVPVETWQEHWFEHEQLVTRVYYDNDVAIYHDDDVNPANTWMSTYTAQVWTYVKSVYGDFGDENRLYAIFHQGKYGGGHPSTYMDASHDYRNVIDIGTYDSWDCQCGWNLDTLTHEISHIVEGASKGVLTSPAANLWGDSKFAEIFNYDVYLNLGMLSEANEAYEEFSATFDSFPRENTFWFRDWFYPIYNSYGNYGGNEVLNRFFDLLAQYFPKAGNVYNGSLNMGEFVHFWSAASGTDLQDLATSAFGWTDAYQSQYITAKQTFVFDDEDGNNSGGETENTISVEVAINNDWISGYCADLYVTNTGDQAVIWDVTVQVEGTVTNLWNGVWSQNGQSLTVSGTGVYASLAAGATTQSIGFCANR